MEQKIFTGIRKINPTDVIKNVKVRIPNIVTDKL